MIDYEVREARDDAERQACYDIRQAVFVDEQNVPEELERDEYDDSGSVHFIALAEGVPLGTGRLRIVGGMAKVQRVAVLSVARRTGAGQALMEAMANHVRAHALAPVITLGAQETAIGFYERLGYEGVGPMFDDAGIPHREMRLTL
ncbi:GNAT family N-acetyltransferase [Rhizobiaceae bacterium]|nr:GNAT family N-acetyltransferase [Rhizobiaceae bacterium]